MRNLRLLSLVSLPSLCAVMGVVACSTSDSSSSGFGTGSGGSYSTGAYSTGAYSSGYAAGAGGGFSGGGGSGIGEPPPPPPPPDSQQDAGTDGAFVCDGLDQTKPVVLYLSADDSNSMGSPVQIRELLRDGLTYFIPSSVRTYEFLNYYNISYPAAPLGTLSLIPQMEDGAMPGEFNLQIGVRSYNAVKPRRPMTITFVLDTSGSMSGEGILREKAAAKAIVSSLAAGDIVNMVTWNTTNNALLSGHPVSGPNDPTVVSIINSLQASGGTNLNAGLIAGYDLANQNYGPSRMNRVILISDGGANVGITDEDLIAANSEDADKEGIYLIGVGTGPAGNYNDVLMDVVTDRGRGAYVYLDSVAEAQRMFVDRFDETMEVAARSVQIEVTLPWYFRIEKFYGEEFSDNPEEIEPQHLAPSDAMIFNQVVRACDPSVIQKADMIKIHARWKTPLTYLDQETSVAMSVDELLATSKTQLTKGKAIVAYAEALKNPTAASLKAAYDAVVAANPGQTDPELNEIASLIPLHPSY